MSWKDGQIPDGLFKDVLTEYFDIVLCQPLDAQLGKRILRETGELFQAKKSGQATGSQRYAQIAPSPQDEQKMLALPFDINSPKMQNAAGLIFFMADMDSPDDPCHPVGP